MRFFPGILIECDVALKTFLLHLNTQTQFVIFDLDETHLFIKNSPDIQKNLQKKIDDWHDSNTFFETVELNASTVSSSSSSKSSKKN